MNNIFKILKKQAKLHEKIDKLDVKFRLASKDCGYYCIYRDQCNHPQQRYKVCNRMTCPYRGDMFYDPEPAVTRPQRYSNVKDAIKEHLKKIRILHRR